MTVCEVAKLINKYFPDNSIEGGMSNSDIELYGDEYLLEPCIEYMLINVLGFCVCGAAEEAEQSLIDILRAAKEYKILELMTKDTTGLITIVLYTLDDKGILEHGSSIGGAWITELGEMLLTLLEKNKQNR